MSSAVNQCECLFALFDSGKQKVSSHDVTWTVDQDGIRKNRVQFLLAWQSHFHDVLRTDHALGEEGKALPQLAGKALSLGAFMGQLLVADRNIFCALCDALFEQP